MPKAPNPRWAVSLLVCKSQLRRPDSHLGSLTARRWPGWLRSWRPPTDPLDGRRRREKRGVGEPARYDQTPRMGRFNLFYPQAPACVVKLARRSSFVIAAATPSIFTLFTLFLRTKKSEKSENAPCVVSLMKPSQVLRRNATREHFF